MAQPQPFPCGRYRPSPVSRREWLWQAGNGFGALALAALWSQQGQANDATPAGAPGPAVDGRGGILKHLHHAPRVKQVIFLYMDGGPSQVDTFDPKPLLTKENGKPFKMKIEPTQFNNIGNTLGSPWKFQQYGQSGIPVSDLFPHVAKHVDQLAVVRSMTSRFSEHTNANYFLHTGSGLQGRPSMGAWLGYGVGSVCENLPGFVVLNGGLVPPGGLDNFGSGFLPASYQGSLFRPSDEPLANIRPLEGSVDLQRRKGDLVARLDAGVLASQGADSQIEAAIHNDELAFRMQAAVPELVDLAGETVQTHQLYGTDSKNRETAIFAKQCLLARRLVERGVRFIELTCPKVKGDRWDQHGNLIEGHTLNALAVDQPIGGLLTDLQQRGLWKDTLVVWAGEFGRTPFAQGADGRDHNPFGFTVWLAGGPIKGGTIYGATDEYGYKVVENKLEIHDLHATLLHVLGIDHLQLTFRFGGRDLRLTDVHGHVIKEILT